MPRISIDSRVVTGENVLFQELQGEAVLLNLDTGVYIGLDRVGARIWSLLGEHKALSDVLQAMIREYDVSSEQCSRDLLDLLQKMEAQGLVSIR